MISMVALSPWAAAPSSSIATLALREDLLLAAAEIDVAPVSVMRACLVAREEPAAAVLAFLFDEVLPFLPIVVFFFEVIVTMH